MKKMQDRICSTVETRKVLEETHRLHKGFNDWKAKVSDPWFKVFAFLGIASHAYSLGELLWVKGTVKLWLNETRMWMIRGVSSFLIAMVVTFLKSLGMSESGFEITSKVIDDREEALKRQEVQAGSRGVCCCLPNVCAPTTLSLLDLYCFLRPTVLVIAKGGPSVLDHMALQMIMSGFIVLVNLPMYEALFLRRDKGRMPTSITVYSTVLVFALLYLLSPLSYDGPLKGFVGTK